MRAFHLPKAVLAAILLLLACPLAAPAQRAGYDLLQTRPGAAIDLSRIPGFSPARIPLRGVPICACTGATDTIMKRTRDVPRGGGTVPVTVVALFLKNSAAVTRPKPRRTDSGESTMPNLLGPCAVEQSQGT